jgi:signal transduction histidine kinase
VSGTEPVVDSAPHVVRRSLRRRVTLLLVLAGVAVAVMVTGAFISYVNLSTARTRVVDRLDPALVATAQLLGSLVDQETGVRGYVLSGDAQFRDPWVAGQAVQEQLTAELAALLADDPGALVVLGELTDAASQWRTVGGNPLMDAAQGTVTEAQLDESRLLFDEVRATHAELETVVAELLADARDAHQRAADWLRAWLAVMTVALVGVLIGIAVELRRSVLRPLESTVDQVRLVAGGDLDHEVVVDGPLEFDQLGQATEAMRRQIVGQLREVDQNRAELAASNRELEQFAYVASHDLQEPLRKVTAFCQLLQQRYGGQLDERADTYIDFAVDGASRMQELINDLLTLSRVGRSSEPMAVVSLDDVVARAVSNVSASIEAAEATVTADPLPSVLGERTLLVGLFQNVISNAVKFRDPERSATVDIHVTGGGDRPFRFDVVDNGIGIEPQYRDRVFVVFQRLHTREEYSGTGIGLAICRKIVEHHGGRMWIADDHDGPGTTISFTLPDPDATDDDQRDPTPTDRPFPTPIATDGTLTDRPPAASTSALSSTAAADTNDPKDT